MENPDGVIRDPNQFINSNNDSILDESEKKLGIGHDIDNEASQSNEQINTWFLGSIMHERSCKEDFNRISTLHNRITQEETKYNDRLLANNRIASILTEFFPFRWLLEITSTFRNVDANKLGVKTPRDRSLSYLGFVEIYLTFRGLTVLDSTLQEINDSLDIEENTPLNKSEIRNWKLKIIQIIPELRNQWVRIRKQAHQMVLMSAVIQVMNKELVLTEYSKEQIFQIKQTALCIARDFVIHPKACHIKKPEVWARAICLKAVQTILGDKHHKVYPGLPDKTHTILENKIWQIENRFNIKSFC